MVQVGQPFPAFALPDQHGRTVRLRDFAGSPLVVYLYPKDDTPGCTTEACSFRDQHPRFEGIGAGVVGLSPDDAASHQAFATKYDLPFPLLADVPGPDGVPPTIAALGCWVEKSMYGRKYMGVARTTFLVGPDGVVTHRWDKVKVDAHADEVLAALAGSGTPAPTTTQRATKKAAKKATKKAVKKVAKKVTKKVTKKAAPKKVAPKATKKKARSR